MTRRMKSYHFSLGNSTNGPVGYCARVLAMSKEEAVEKLSKILPESHNVFGDNQFREPLGPEYVEVYFNCEGFPTVDDIDEWEWEDVPDDYVPLEENELAMDQFAARSGLV